MPLETRDHVPRDFFEHLWCPVCGSRRFEELRYAFVACEGCYGRVRVLADEHGDELWVHVDMRDAINSVDTREEADHLDTLMKQMPSEKVSSVWHVKEDGYEMKIGWEDNRGDGSSWTPARPEPVADEVDEGADMTDEWRHIARN